MSSYTCNACELQFPGGDNQRQHMKSEWHRYNLKRRVAQLAPIPEDIFNSKVQALAAQDDKDDGKQKQLTKKELRRREKEALLERKRELLKVAHENAANNIQKEVIQEGENEPEANVETKVETKANEQNNSGRAQPHKPELTEDELAEKLMQEKISNRVEIPLEECLFCGKKHSDLDKNIDHMLKNHGFFIPEQKFLVDKPGLIKYISEKIGLGNICIACNFQGRSLEAVRQHMLAKRHCRIPYEEEDEKLEISDFYDFTSSYGGPQQPVVVEADGDDDDEDWEDVTGNEEEVSDEEIPEDAVYHDGIELHLPTGFKVGHRSLMKYYRQNLKPESEVTEGQGTVMAAETRKMLQPYDRREIQTQKKSWQQEKRNQKQQEKKSARHKNFQPHYRDQLLQ